MKTVAKVIIALSLIFSIIILLGACQTAPENEIPTEVAFLVETEVPPTEIPTQIPVAPTAVLTDECLDCHLDKERLIDTAKPEVILESENDGEG